MVRAAEAAAGIVHGALARVLECYALAGKDASIGRRGSRAHFLVLLHHARRAASRRLNNWWELYAHEQTKTNRLRAVFEFIGERYGDRISLPQVAAVARLSRPQFHAAFAGRPA